MEIIKKDYSWAYALTKQSKPLTLMVLHHAAAGSCTPDDVHAWHIANGWCGIGYHFFVAKDGSVYEGRPLWAMGAHLSGCNDGSVYEGRPLWAMGAHLSGCNDGSVGICFEGNFETEYMGKAQTEAGAALVRCLLDEYPGITRIRRHCDLGSSACPGKYFPLSQIVPDTAPYGTEPDGQVPIRELSVGDSGDAVRSVQFLMEGYGYGLPCYGADGVFGDETELALINFQAAAGLTPDGICGVHTYSALLGLE